VVESESGVRQAIIRWDENWLDMVGWAGNSYMMIDVRKEEALYSLLTYNPFTGKQEELIPEDYPDVDPFVETGMDMWGYHFMFSNLMPSPDSNLLVYPQRLETNKGYQWFYTLWDRQSNQALAKVETVAYFFNEPLWTADGEQFVILVNYRWVDWKEDSSIDEFFSVSRNGEIRQLTHFDQNMNIGTYSLSPNGRYLAFWVSEDPNVTNYLLAVLNIETGMVVNYCVPGSSLNVPSSPIWSIDSRYIAVDNYYATNAHRTILVDTQASWAAVVDEAVSPFGWLK
jgi:hypothetical protein